ncbi:unnamed protein product [Caenorhabditis sp. 36 PRJEB53466]|nr:unnamed protein product [Caenorhabditis sp. 36 PRJEB53466]
MLNTVLIMLLVPTAGFGARYNSHLVKGWSNSDCVRPWQQAQMSKPTLRIPSRAIECHPEDHNCPAGRNPVCQYSMRSQKYVCCEDKRDADIPTCPKYYETLLLPCGSSVDSQCPRGYRCLGSLGDDSIKLCCKPNRTLEYREPEHTFRENRVVPRLLPVAPAHELIATFNDEQISMGQLFDASVLERLADPPVMTAGVELQDEKLYTIILADATSKSVTWLVANIAAFDGQLEIHRRTKSAVSYQPPDSTDKPVGMHVMILALFEQNDTWSQKDLATIGLDEFSFGEWLDEYAHILPNRPLAATFYGYSTRKDDRKRI